MKPGPARTVGKTGDFLGGNILEKPIFIGGAGRSGTTLLRVILDSHSRIACGPELKVTPVVAKFWKDFQLTYRPLLANHHINETDINRLFREFLSGLLWPLQQRSGKPRVAEKSPNNVFFFNHLLHIFPDARFIHIIRDGRDVAASLLGMNWKGPDGKAVAYTQSALAAAAYWKQAVTAGRAFADRAEGQCCLEIRYEDLVLAPEITLKTVFRFLEEPWEADVLNFRRAEHDYGRGESSSEQVQKNLYSSSIGRWKQDLSADDVARIDSEIAPLLRELGYTESSVQT